MDFLAGLFIGYLITALWLAFMYWLVSRLPVETGRR
jgi:hypothetical protein